VIPVSDLLDFPSKIQIQTHNLCNYACKMCPYPAGSPRKREQMPESLLERLLAELERERRAVDLCLMLQNEPLLDARFPALLASAHASPFVKSIYTVTNGSRLTPALMDELLAYQRFFLTVSVNALDSKRYLEVHGRDRYDRVRQLLESWQGDRSRVAVSCVVARGNIPLARRFREEFAELGYSVRLLPMSTRAGSQPSDQLLHEPDLEFGHCSYPVDTLTVRWDGEVLLCCQDWEHEETFGNLQHSSIAELWNAPRLSELREAALTGTLRAGSPCKTCDVPVNSIERARIDRLLNGDDSPLQGTAGQTLLHETLLRGADGNLTSAVVRSIEPATGRIIADCEALPAAGEEQASSCRQVSVLLPIGLAGSFSLARPTQVWCQASVEIDAAAPGTQVIFRLSDQDPGRRFLDWYAADWRVPVQPAQRAASCAAG
jgi:radical SAM protein with 4Fe4S-binding SPASM domain